MEKNYDKSDAIKTYLTYVLPDGSIIMEEFVPEPTANEKYFGASSRIKQILALLEYIRSNYHDENDIISSLITEGISTVSQQLAITKSSLYDKISRQCNTDIRRFEKFVWNWLENDSSQLKEHLLANSSQKYAEADKKAIETFFSE